MFGFLGGNGTRFGGWLLNTGDNRFELGEQTLRLHVKVLTNPTISIDRMVVAMQQVYESVGIRVHRVSTETLNLPALNDVDVGECGNSVTSEQTQLFANRNNAWGSDVVVYFVLSPTQAERMLDRLKDDPDAGIRKVALTSAVRLTSPRLAAKLRQMAEMDPEPFVRDAAAATVKKMKTKGK